MNQFWPWIYLIVTNARIQKDDKYLIAQRSLNEKHYPWYWTIVWWKLEAQNWHNVLEENLKKEILEEVWIHVTEIKFLWNYYINQDNRKCLYITFWCKRLSWEAQALEDTENIQRLTLEELKNFKEPSFLQNYLSYIAK